MSHGLEQDRDNVFAVTTANTLKTEIRLNDKVSYLKEKKFRPHYQDQLVNYVQRNGHALS
jgi:hypothetical protein